MMNSYKQDLLMRTISTKGHCTVDHKVVPDLQDAIAMMTADQLRAFYAALDSSQRNFFFFVAGKVLAMDAFQNVMRYTVLSETEQAMRESIRSADERAAQKLAPLMRDAQNAIEAAQVPQKVLEAIAPLARYAGIIEEAVKEKIRDDEKALRSAYWWLRKAAGIEDVPIDYCTDDLIRERVADERLREELLACKRKIRQMGDAEYAAYEASIALSRVRLPTESETEERE
jgi:hypothetical protein